MISKRLGRQTALVAALALLAVGAGASSAPAAHAGSQAAEATQAPATLTVRNTRYGVILFDGSGRALYGFTRDQRGGPSQCYGPCAVAWPVYLAKGTPRAGKGVKRSLIGTTRRRDGRRQLTYNGWPLYYYIDDTEPGEVSCQNVAEFGGLWLIVRPKGGLVR